MCSEEAVVTWVAMAFYVYILINLKKVKTDAVLQGILNSHRDVRPFTGGQEV